MKKNEKTTKPKRRKFWQASYQVDYSFGNFLSQETSHNCYRNKKDVKKDLKRLIKMLIDNGLPPEDIHDQEIIPIWIYE